MSARGLFIAAVLLALLPSAIAGGPLSIVPGSAPPQPFQPLQPAAGEEQDIVIPVSLGKADASEAADGSYGVRFKCPEIVYDRAEEQAGIEAATCPLWVFDQEDIMSQPILAVDPQNFNIMAFNALHGGRGLHAPPELGGSVPPSDRSRYNTLHQPHTTFRSTKAGAEWSDERYYAPEALRDGNERIIFGEDNAFAIDAEGKGYIASLYAWKEQAEKNYHYTVALWKTHRLNRAINYYESLSLKHTTSAFNKIDSLHAVYAPGAHRVLVMWRESITNASANKDGMAGWVEFYSTIPGEGAQWQKQPQIQRVGPCRAITNPLAVGPYVYFGCLPDRGFSGAANASYDRWQMFSIDPKTLNTKYLSPVPMGTPQGMLVDRGGTGYMIFIGSGLDAGVPNVLMSYGALGANWQDVESYGRELRNDNMPERATRAEARVTAAIFTRETGNIHLLFMEKYRFQGNAQEQVDRQGKTYYKTYAVVRPIAGFRGKFDESLQFGEGRSRLQIGLPYQGGFTEDVFNDLHDSIVVWKDVRYKGKEKIFVAFGDYGYIRFGEVVEENAGIAIPLPPLSPPPIPVPLEAVNPAASGTAAAALMGLMLLRLLAARKKAAVETTA